MAEYAAFVGKQVGNYRIVAPVASGSYGSVYKAQHVTFNNRFVAVKIMHTSFVSKKEQEDFFREAQLLEQLRHRYILPLLDIGMIEEGNPYFLLEYAAGGSLQQRLNSVAPRLLPPYESLHLLRQLSEALAYAHQQNVIHRDLKPANILFTRQGEVRLADFGVATLLATSSIKHSQILGTPAYMAPEQFKGEICKENDQYALACMTYELCTGHQPFSAPDIYSMAFKHMQEQPVPPRHYNTQLPLYIEQVILKAMSKERKDRFPDITAFVQALMGPSPIPAAVVAPLEPPTMPIGQSPALFRSSAPAQGKKKRRKGQLRLDIAQLTDGGRYRSYNQDNMAYVVPRDPLVMVKKGAMFVIADGGDSQQAGEVASEIAVDTITKMYYHYDSDTVEDALCRAVERANALIYQKAAENARYSGMSAKCIVAVLREYTAHIAAMNNNHAYVVREKEIKRIAQDHVWGRERGWTSGYLTPGRALGSDQRAEIALFVEELEKGDTLLFCSDGLDSSVDMPTLRAIMEQYMPQESVYHLIERAKENSSQDDITAVVIRVH